MAEKVGGTDPREVLMRQNLFQKRQTNSPVEYQLIVSVDDDCFYHYSWRNNVVIAFGTFSSFLT